MPLDSSSIRNQFVSGAYGTLGGAVAGVADTALAMAGIEIPILPLVGTGVLAAWLINKYKPGNPAAVAGGLLLGASIVGSSVNAMCAEMPPVTAAQPTPVVAQFSGVAADARLKDTAGGLVYVMPKGAPLSPGV